ncbi:Lactation elevated protein 1 [Hordeum vulgare]|nr:Lactation elevated protein 1 [Hordeum vulgare]
MEVAHAQSRSTDLIAGHVAPAVALLTNALARKRQGNIVMQDGILASPAGREGAPSTAAVARSARPPAWKMSKVWGVKRKKVPTKKPSSAQSAPARHSPTVPFYGAASTAGEVFDERVGRTTWTFRSLQGRWGVIKPTRRHWAACLEQVRNAPPSAIVESDYVSWFMSNGSISLHNVKWFHQFDFVLIVSEKIAQQRYKDMDASEGIFFKLEYCWELLKNCKNWALIDKESPPKRGSLTDMDEDEDDNGPRNLNKPDGDIKTKEKIKRKHEASTLRDKIDAMLQSNEVLQSNEAKIELAKKKARGKQER